MPTPGSEPSPATPTPRAGDAAAPMPGWVKVSLIVVAALVVLVLAAMLIPGGHHGPGRHLGQGGERIGGTTSASVDLTRSTVGA